MLSERTIKALDGIRKCSIGGKRKVRDLFEIMVKHPDLWLHAYANISTNPGAVTKGTDDVTQDGFSAERVKNLIKLLKQGRYFPKPSKRIRIPKANGSLRPLSMPSGDDKLVQEVVRIILETIYEPIFAEDSHGFRPRRSCHTALEHINTWTGAVWLIEFDIKSFDDTIHHLTLVRIMSRTVDDVKFLQLVRRMLRAGYMENWKLRKTYSGTPQGSIASPVMANIYLNELDTFILNLKYNRGRKQSANPQYQQIARQKEKLRKQLKQMGKEGAEVGSRRPLHDTLNELTRQQRSIPSGNPGDLTYRRLWLCRYADDLLIGLIGPKQEAQAIKDQVQTFLRDELKLELAAEKTGIRHAKTEGATFLGYNVKMADSQKELKVKIHGSYVTKRTNRGTPTLGVPVEKVRKFCQAKGYGHSQTLKSCHRPELLGLSDAEIIHTFNAELRGFANFYALAKDVKSKLHRLFFLAHSSFVKTLAAKYRMKQSEILTKYRTGADLTVICETPGKAKILKLFKLSELKTIPRRYGEIDKWPNTFAFQSTNPNISCRTYANVILSVGFLSSRRR